MPYQGRQPGVGVRNRFIFIAPSDDVTGEPQEVQALVALMHTPAVIAAYAAHLAAQAGSI